ncbi:MAG: DUF320 domain-containing protein [Aliifodinibius sp.]|nr:chaplin [Fodinibius sp.]NIV11506.1 DUF320 domain-containing protein [Fodinibius sp.]NIY25106.1 DUF320 domain-containing protein [Fodinibius sp.]
MYPDIKIADDLIEDTMGIRSGNVVELPVQIPDNVD